MKNVYINEKKKLTPRRIKKIAKKVNKINKKEEALVLLSDELQKERELIAEIESYKIKVLDR